MTQQEIAPAIDLRTLVWDICTAQIRSYSTVKEEKDGKYTEDLAICQNPQCYDAFIPEPGDDEALVCPTCKANLPDVEIQNIRFMLQHGLHPEVYGGRD